MSNGTDFPLLERPAFFDGQRLTAADLTTVQRFHRELRWLHNRSLHNWGIAFGYAVTGVRKGRTVYIQPGYALDCQGRELILNTATTLAIPAVADDGAGAPKIYYLTVAYADDADLTPETRTGACGTAGAVRRPEQPLLRWQDPNAGYRYGLDVVLASIQVQNCQLAADVSGVERRDAVPAQQPYIAAGQSEAGATAWSLWPNTETPVGVRATIATTVAGFRTPPRYQAHVMGERVIPPDNSTETPGSVFDGYAQVTNATATGFDLIVLLPVGRIGNFLLNPVVNSVLLERLNNKEELGWFVVWMGIEGEV